MLKLKDVLSDYIRGPFGSALRRSELSSFGIPVYEQQHAIDDTRYFRYYINKEKSKEMKRFLVKPNDIIISCSGTVGKTSIISKDDKIGIISQALLILRPNTSLIVPKYLKYILDSKYGQNAMLSVSYGSVQINIAPRKSIENIQISLPDLKKQQEIVEKISMFENKISQNKILIEKIEEYFRLVFHKWFVDFNFPNENGNPYKDSGGRIIEFDGKLIPISWKEIPLSDSASFINGLAMQNFPPKDDFDLLPIIKIREINNKGFSKDTKFATKSIDKNLIINDGDILFPWSGSLNVNIWVGGVGGLNQHIFKVNCEKFEKWYIYLWIKNHMRFFEQIAYGKKTTMGHINRKHLKHVNILVPDMQTLQRMNSMMSPLYNEIVNLNIENRMLKDYKELLILKYIK